LSVYLRGRVYWFKRMIGGREYRRSLDIRKGQEILLSEAVKLMDLEITAAHLGIPFKRQTAVPFDTYVEHYLAQEKNQAGRFEWTKKKQRLAIVAEAWGSTALHAIDRDAVLRLERHLLEERRVAESTVNRYFEVLRHLFGRAIEEGHVKDNPVRLYYQPFREEGGRRALSADEISRVIAAAAKVQGDPRGDSQGLIYDLCLFGLHTGARLGECLALRFEHVRDDVAYLPIAQTKSRRRAPKRQTARIKPIVLDDAAKGIVERRRRCRPEAFVFRLKRQDPNEIFYAIHRIRKLSGIQDFSFHVLRHTFITAAAETFGISRARDIVSHADLKTTSRYTHPQLAEIRAALTKLGTMFPSYEIKNSSGDKEKD
jgi:integrase